MCALSGWMVTVTLLMGIQRLAPDHWDPPPDPAPLCHLRPGAPPPVRRISPRTWAGLTGVGPTPALALARPLWAAGAAPRMPPPGV